MLETIIKEEKNILTPLNPRKTEFLGLINRVTKSPFSKKYDEKHEITMYFIVSGEPFIIQEKQEFLDDKMVRCRHICGNNKVKVMCDKESSDFKQITTKYYISDSKSFVIKEFTNKNKKMKVYGNDWFYFVKDDGFDNERLYGIFLVKPDENGLIEVNENDFKKCVEG